jgi:hypothetical protein
MICAAQPPTELTESDSVTQTDSLVSIKSADSLVSTKSTDSPQGREKIPLSKHTYDHRSQMILGACMMAFIALMLGTAQSWNPR